MRMGLIRARQSIRSINAFALQVKWLFSRLRLGRIIFIGTLLNCLSLNNPFITTIKNFFNHLLQFDVCLSYYLFYKDQVYNSISFSGYVSRSGLGRIIFLSRRQKLSSLVKIPITDLARPMVYVFPSRDQWNRRHHCSTCTRNWQLTLKALKNQTMARWLAGQNKEF